MTLDLAQLLLLGIGTSATHWLIARAEISRPLWSRAPAGVDRMLRCAGCTGWWLGLAAGAVGVRPVVGPSLWVQVLGAGVLAVFVTPVFEAVLLWGLERSAVPDDGDGSGDAGEAAKLTSGD